MHPTTTELFGETIQKTGEWLDELMAQRGNFDPRQAYSILRAVLHGLRDRLTADEAVNLGAQLPMLVRGFYYDGWRPAARPVKSRHKAEFLQLVAQAYPGLPAEELESSVRAVFTLLSRHVSSGEIDDIRNQMPPEMQSLWESAA